MTGTSRRLRWMYLQLQSLYKTFFFVKCLMQIEEMRISFSKSFRSARRHRLSLNDGPYRLSGASIAAQTGDTQSTIRGKAYLE